MNRFDDVRSSSLPWILKIEYSTTEIAAIRYYDFMTGIEFMNAIAEHFGQTVTLCYMSQREFLQQALERNHPEWIDLIQDGESLEDISDF